VTARKPPAWLDLSEPRSDRARPQRCRRCGAPILRALAGHIAALDVRADPTPLDPTAEILARLAGRLTWCLVETPHTPPRICWRTPEHIAGGRCTHPVLADHTCPPHPIQEALL
jgi:hypothetical protein